ncbi:alpha/beta hydrolase [Aeromicrobium sp. UC242_57]|uniref:alpha/beta hydrolase n=1 Tax=Aeromicrobium sp. UC242_57 TaxID=3374624 RepID=UPI003791AAAD
MARANFEANFAALPVDQIHKVEDFVATAPGVDIPLRMYRPSDAQALAVIVYFHGGGWQMGSIDSHDGICRSLANATGSAVISVGYRRPPESRFPTAPHDCFAALTWIVGHACELGVDARRLALAGDSAGGNLAAAVAILARNGEGPVISCQALIYPATTFDLDVGFDMDFEGVVLMRDEVLWHRGAYFEDEADAASPLASPLGSDLDNLPSTLVITAEYDPLHRQGELFHEALVAAGVDSTLRPFAGMIHGFAQFPMLFDEADAAIAEIGEFISKHTGAVA